MRKSITGIAFGVFAIAVLVLAACAPSGGGGSANTSTGTATSSAPATTGPSVFVAKLDALNGSGVSGNATVTVNGSSVAVTISATGMVPNQKHAQHIHSMSSTDSTCPPASAATSGSVMSEQQAEKYYGPVLVPLEPFPTATADGAISYSAEVTGVPAAGLPLKGRAIVLHGLNVNGTYDPSVPVACGELFTATSTAAPPSSGTSTPPSGMSTPSTGATPGGGSSTGTGSGGTSVTP